MYVFYYWPLSPYLQCLTLPTTIHASTHLSVQVQVSEVAVTDGALGMAVHCQVDLPAVALDGDIVPVLIVQQVSHCKGGETLYFMDSAAPWGKKSV